jgi:hypothetical protein
MQVSRKKIFKSLLSEDGITNLVIVILTFILWNAFFDWEFDILIAPLFIAIVIVLMTWFYQIWYKDYKKSKFTLSYFSNIQRASSFVLYLYYVELLLLFFWRYYIQRNPGYFAYTNSFFMLLLCSLNFGIFVWNYLLIMPNSTLYLQDNREEKDAILTQPIKLPWAQENQFLVKLILIGNLIFFIITFYMGYLHNLIFQTGKIWEISMAFPPGEGDPLSIPWTGFWYIELGAQIISILVILYLKFRKIGKLPEDHFITLLTQNSSLETLDAQLIKNLVLKKDKQLSTKKDEVL